MLKMRKKLLWGAAIALFAIGGNAPGLAETPVVDNESGNTFVGHDTSSGGRSTADLGDGEQNAGSFFGNSLFFDGEAVHLETSGGEQTLPGAAGAATDGNAEGQPGVDNHF